MGQPSRPAMVTPWGKCLASVKTTIPEETERLLREENAALRRVLQGH